MKIRVNNQSFINFEDLTIDSQLDSVASIFSISAYFDFDNPEHKVLFKPLSYNKIEIIDDDDSKLLTGTILNHDFDAKSTTELIQISGYSLPGVIEDCNVPYSMYPLESLKMNLGEIARKLIKPFGLQLIVDSSVQKDVNLVYPKTVCEPEDSIKDYLSKLAAQRNIVISHTTDGHLLMFRPDSKAKSVELFTEQNTTSMTLSVNGQSMHSQLTVLRQPKMKKEKTEKQKKVSTPAQYDSNGYEIEPPKVEVKTVKERPKAQFFDTIKNPMINAFRPAVKKMTEGEDVSTESAVKNLISDEYRNIKFTISIDNWKRIKPGDIIDVESKRLFLAGKIRLMIESISKTANASEKNMVINAVLPETFTGDIPKNIFI